jgi:hypothetical protein
MTEAARSSKASVNFCQTIRCHIPEESIPIISAVRTSDVTLFTESHTAIRNIIVSGHNDPMPRATSALKNKELPLVITILECITNSLMPRNWCPWEAGIDWSRYSQHFMESPGSLQCSQRHTRGPYVRYISILHYYPGLGHPRCLTCSGFPTKKYASFCSLSLSLSPTVPRRFHRTKTHSLQAKKLCSRYGGTTKWQFCDKHSDHHQLLKYACIKTRKVDVAPNLCSLFLFHVSSLAGTGQPVGVPSSPFQWNVKFKCAVNAINFSFFMLLFITC